MTKAKPTETVAPLAWHGATSLRHCDDCMADGGHTEEDLPDGWCLASDVFWGRAGYLCEKCAPTDGDRFEPDGSEDY